MLPVPPRLKFHGNTHAAKQFKRFALSQLEILKKQMSFQGLKQGVRRVSPFEGVLIECVSKFGLHVVNVFVAVVAQEAYIKGYISLEKSEVIICDIISVSPIPWIVVGYDRKQLVYIDTNHLGFSPIFMSPWEEPTYTKLGGDEGSHAQVQSSVQIKYPPDANEVISTLSIICVGDLSSYTIITVSRSNAVTFTDCDPIGKRDDDLDSPYELVTHTFGVHAGYDVYKFALKISGKATASLSQDCNTLYIQNETSLKTFELSSDVSPTWVEIKSFPTGSSEFVSNDPHYIDRQGLAYSFTALDSLAVSDEIPVPTPACPSYIIYNIWCSALAADCKQYPDGTNNYGPVDLFNSGTFKLKYICMDANSGDIILTSYEALGLSIENNDLIPINSISEYTQPLYRETLNSYYKWDETTGIFMCATSGQLYPFYVLPTNSTQSSFYIYNNNGTLNSSNAPSILSWHSGTHFISILGSYGFKGNNYSYELEVINRTIFGFDDIIGLSEESGEFSATWNGTDWGIGADTKHLHTKSGGALNVRHNIINKSQVVVGTYDGPYQGFPIHTPPPIITIEKGKILYPFEIDDAEGLRSFVMADYSKTISDSPLVTIGLYYKNLVSNEKLWRIEMNNVDITSEVLDSSAFTEEQLSYIGFLF
jgi:hypothetical protein